jgi:hypothetical protein
MGKFNTHEEAVGAFNAPGLEKSNDVQIAVFCGGKITAWWEGEQDILNRSRQGAAGAPGQPKVRLLPPDNESVGLSHQTYVFKHPTIGYPFMVVVARDEDTALRIAENATVGINWEGVVPTPEGDKIKGPNRIEHLDKTGAPLVAVAEIPI